MRSPPVLVLVAIVALFTACKTEPPDISEEEARGIAAREMLGMCDAEGSKCSDFKELGKRPPSEAGFEFAWHWVAPNPERPTLLMVLVTKKGVPATRVTSPSPADLAAAAGKPAVAGTPAPPGVSTATAKGAPVAPVAVSTGAALVAKAAPKADPKSPPKPDSNLQAVAEKTPPPVSAPATSPPPAPSGETTAVEPTFKEVFSACETEIGILCLSTPASVYQARRCLTPHKAALRRTCGKVVGLKRSEL